jgi:hypothetical protein
MELEDWSLSVGVRYYPDPNLRDLDGPEADARDFHAWVTSANGGKVDTHSGRAKLIVSSDYGERPKKRRGANPTVEEINKFFHGMEDVLDQRDENKEDSKIGRRIYLYFSGHGFMPTSDKEEDVAVLMADAQDPNFLGNHVLANAWADVLYKSGYFEEVLLFVTRAAMC